jgi:hypothetical protein
VRLGQRLQAEDVRARAVEDGKDFGSRAESLAEAPRRRAGVVVVAVPDEWPRLMEAIACSTAGCTPALLSLAKLRPGVMAGYSSL